MICVLDVVAGPARGKRFWIRADETLQIGRISTADFSVPTDRHMSRHHLIMEGTDGTFRVRDVGSANGTYVNNAKVTAIQLCDGDQIKAGETVFDVSVIDDAENPHAKDLTFNASVSSEQAVAVAEPPSKVRSSHVSAAGNVDSSVDSGQRRAVDPSSNIASPAARLSDDDSTSRCNDDDLIAEVQRDSLNSGRWWAQFSFRPTNVSRVFEQSEGSEEIHAISSVIKHLESSFAITAVVNTEGVRRFDRQLVDSLGEEGLVTWQSPSVCSIQNNGSRDFCLLADSLATQDAFILLATRSGLDPNTLADVAIKASRPSRLHEFIKTDSTDFVEQLLAGADVVLFEQDASGRLSMLLAS